MLWKAWDEQVMRPVAIKVLKAGPEALEALRKEGIAAGGLSHKNIVQIYDFNAAEGYLVGEFIEGRSLEETLNDQRTNKSWISQKQAVEILRQCLEALEHAHERNRVHGDVKPANILIRDRTGEVKLTDFGVAKILSARAEKFVDSAAPGGSVTYAAPEVLKGEKTAPDFQSDLFSLGMISYLLLTKRHPFVDETAIKSIPEMIESDYSPVSPRNLDSEITRNLEQLTMKLLAKDKGIRYKNARQALDSLLAEELGQIPCPNCGNKNPTAAKFCNDCGKQLFEEAKGKQPEVEAVLAAQSLFGQGLVYDAISKLEGALNEHPKFAMGWQQLGFIYNNIRKYESAESACSRAVALDSTLATAYQTRGFARSNLGNFDGAIADFNEALKKTSDPRRRAQILYHRGHSQMLAGNLDAACKDASEALKFNSANESAKWLQSVVCH